MAHQVFKEQVFLGLRKNNNKIFFVMQYKKARFSLHCCVFFFTCNDSGCLAMKKIAKN
jgi:hypothetical protein